MARRKKKWLTMWAEYLGLRTFSGLMHCMDVDQNLHAAASFGSLYWSLGGSRRERAERNIRLAFPEYSPQEVSDAALRSIQNMFQMFMVDALVMPRLLTPEAWPRFVDLGELRPAMDRLVRGEPMIFITGHCGNWELLGFCLAVIGFPIHAVIRPLDNPLINNWMTAMREARGMKLVSKWGVADRLERILERGGRLGFVADQNAGDQGLFVPFFGRLASCYKSIGLLAMRHEVPIVTASARRLNGRFQFDMSCLDSIGPDDWADQPDPLFYITARFNRAMEDMVRRAPDQYLWAHRRWKSRPRHERQGQPMPARLIRKLEDLPWMTQEELDLIMHRSNANSEAVCNGREMPY